jgi:hypothetical protein
VRSLIILVNYGIKILAEPERFMTLSQKIPSTTTGTAMIVMRDFVPNVNPGTSSADSSH